MIQLVRVVAWRVTFVVFGLFHAFSRHSNLQHACLGLTSPQRDCHNLSVGRVVMYPRQLRQPSTHNVRKRVHTLFRRKTAKQVYPECIPAKEALGRCSRPFSLRLGLYTTGGPSYPHAQDPTSGERVFTFERRKRVPKHRELPGRGSPRMRVMSWLEDTWQTPGRRPAECCHWPHA